MRFLSCTGVAGVLAMLSIGCLLRAGEFRPWTGNPKVGAEELEEMWAPLSQAAAAFANGNATAVDAKSIGIRGVFRMALEATALPPSGWNGERVEAILAFGRSQQDLDVNSKTYGNFKWASNQVKVFDQNAAEFSGQILGLLHKKYFDRLTPKAQARLVQIMDTAVNALKTHEIKVEYTNIWLMKSWDLIAFGECLKRADVAEEGYKRFDQWIEYTARNGIGEYGAVTYYGVDLDSLGLIAKFADRPEAREKAMKAIRYLWTDAAANWWAPGDRLGGANARSYDYLFGRGYLEAYTWPAGWLRSKPELESAGWVNNKHTNLVAFMEGAWVPPETAWTEQIRSTFPRMVVQRWGAGKGQQASNWLSKNVSIASSGAPHGRDERTFLANLGATPDVPQMVIFMDGRNDPFGTKKTSNAANQAKALHLVPFNATVQRGPEVLQVLSMDPLAKDTGNRKGDLNSFATHLTIPGQAEVWVDDQRVTPGPKNNPLIIKANQLVSVKIGQGVVAMRIAYANVTPGETWKQPEIRLIEEKAKNIKMYRLTIVHDRNEPRGRATAALWLRAADNIDAAGFAAFRKAFATAKCEAAMTRDVIKVVVAGMSGPMRIEADVTKKAADVLEGAEPVQGILNINGRDIGGEILGVYNK